jgi:catechol 2,3-dioxygenase-like lactoylglutathione lyase family enzyme
MGSVRTDRLDHLVLTVADIDATVEFYTAVCRPGLGGLGLLAHARNHLQGVNRGAGASASMTTWW